MALTLRTIMKTKNIENIKPLFFIISLNYISLEYLVIIKITIILLIILLYYYKVILL